MTDKDFHEMMMGIATKKKQVKTEAGESLTPDDDVVYASDGASYNTSTKSLTPSKEQDRQSKRMLKDSSKDSASFEKWFSSEMQNVNSVINENKKKRRV